MLRSSVARMAKIAALDECFRLFGKPTIQLVKFEVVQLDDGDSSHAALVTLLG